MFKQLRTIDFYILVLFVAYVAFYAQEHANAVLSSFELSQIGDATIGKLITLTFCGLACFKLHRSPYKLPLFAKKLLIAWITVTSLSNVLLIESLPKAINVSFQQMLWSIVFFYFYTIGKSGINEILLKSSVVVLYGLLFFIIYSETVYLRTFGQYAQQIQINEIYFILLMFPWILMLKGNKVWGILRILLLLTSIWFVFYSLKRTAILGMGLAISAFMFGLYRQKKIHFNTILLISTAIIGGYFLFNFVNEEFDGRIIERIISIKTDKGTGRMDIYTNVFKAIHHWELPEYMFGVGRGLIGNYTGGYSAHNEFLEILFSWGFIALIIYICFVFKIWQLFYHHQTYLDLPIVFSAFGVYVAMCITSHLVIYPYLFNLLAACWGYHLAKIGIKKI